MNVGLKSDVRSSSCWPVQTSLHAEAVALAMPCWAGLSSSEAWSRKKARQKIKSARVSPGLVPGQSTVLPSLPFTPKEHPMCQSCAARHPHRFQPLRRYHLILGQQFSEGMADVPTQARLNEKLLPAFRWATIRPKQLRQKHC